MEKKGEVNVWETKNLIEFEYVPNKARTGGTFKWKISSDPNAKKGKLRFEHHDNPGGGSFSAINDGDC